MHSITHRPAPGTTSCFSCRAFFRRSHCRVGHHSMPDHMSLQDLHTQYSCQGDGMCQVSLQFILNTFLHLPSDGCGHAQEMSEVPFRQVPPGGEGGLTGGQVGMTYKEAVKQRRARGGGAQAKGVATPTRDTLRKKCRCKQLAFFHQPPPPAAQPWHQLQMSILWRSSSH